VTVQQVRNLLSLSGIWQFVLLFYIMSGAVRSKSDVVTIMKYLVATLIFGIIFRMAQGQNFFLLSLTAV